MLELRKGKFSTEIYNNGEFMGDLYRTGSGKHFWTYNEKVSDISFPSEKACIDNLKKYVKFL